MKRQGQSKGVQWADAYFQASGFYTPSQAGKVSGYQWERQRGEGRGVPLLITAVEGWLPLGRWGTNIEMVEEEKTDY